MILLDTDHASVLKYRDTARYNRLAARLAGVIDEPIGVTIITVEEQMRGWLAAIAKERQSRRQVGPYRELARLFEFFADFEITPFDNAAADRFDQFNRIRISSADRKIAAIALANGALLLTANRRDYEQVAGLRFENWMDEPPAAGGGAAGRG
jgi:tRNA(fMet)-specific endonuclease VapC